MVNGISSLDGQFVNGVSGVKHEKLAILRGEAPIKYIVVTHTAGTGNAADAQAVMYGYGTSAHYLIDKDGRMKQAYPDSLITYTTGKSYFDGNVGLNKNTISVMFGNIGWSEQGDLYTENQITTYNKLLDYFKTEYPGVKVLELAEVATSKHIALGNFFPRAATKPMIEVPEGTSFECKINLNDAGKEVTALQIKLGQFGYGYDGAALKISGVYDEATMKVANIFHKANVQYTTFTLEERVFNTETGEARNFYVPANAELLAQKEPAATPATPNCWSDADDYVLDALIVEAYMAGDIELLSASE